MIDWVTAIIPCHHDEIIFGGVVTSIDLDGVIEWRVEKKQQVRGSYESNINIRSEGNHYIFLDGNLVKWLQGHNIFGSDDLIGIVEEVMHKLTLILGLTPTKDNFVAWRKGLYYLKRVDCTAMWDLPRRSDVRSWLRAAEMQSTSRHGRPVTRGSTLYFGQHSRRWTVKFYSKGDEIEAKNHNLPIDIYKRDNLIEYSDNKLRGELTLRSLQLKERNLDSAMNWKEKTTINLLISYIETLKMSEQFNITPVDLDGLPARLIAVYKLWKEGEDLRALYPKASFYRYRSEFLKLGIDIAIRQPSKPENVVPLIRILRPEAIAQVPDWAIDTPLYFAPKRRS